MYTKKLLVQIKICSYFIYQLKINFILKILDVNDCNTGNNKNLLQIIFLLFFCFIEYYKLVLSLN